MAPSRAHLTGSRIRDLRLDRGIRQADLAGMAGISASYLNLIEHNRRRIGGKLLLDIAQALRVEPAVLSEGAAAGQIAALRDAAAAVPASNVETERTEEFAGRFPGWAGLIAMQARRVAALERRVETLNDRLAHDPFLSASLHDVLTTVTAIRATSAILDSDEEVDAEWRARFHRNLHEDSRRLAESSRALVAYLDAAGEAEDAAVVPLEEVEAWYAGRGWKVPEVEDAAPEAVAALADAAEMSRAGRVVLGLWLERQRAAAAALPLAALAAAGGSEADPAVLAGNFGSDLATVLRRLALLPGRQAPAGLAICDGSGTLVFRRPVDGFPLPRFGAACPLWPLYQALARPMTPVRAVLEMPGRTPQVFLAHAVAQPATLPCVRRAAGLRGDDAGRARPPRTARGRAEGGDELPSLPAPRMSCASRAVDRGRRILTDPGAWAIVPR